MAGEADAALGRWLRRLRAEAGLTQQEVADRSGLSVRTVSNIERGRSRKPYPVSVRLIGGALGVPESDSDKMIAWLRRSDGHPLRSGDPRGGDPLPRQLPARVRHFVGRADELGRLEALLGETGAGAVAATISGMAGVGKTALAVHWAHQVADRFPDGQMYVNLRGFDPSGRPVPPGEAIRGFLDALRVPAERVPASLDAQAGLYRSLVAGRRMLVLLDNARDSDQVRPLLPGSPGCLVLVTSRAALTGLAVAEDACPVSLDVLSAAEAGDLLGHRLGSRRAGAEPAVIGELGELCARLPLALSIVAARAAAAPGPRLADLAAGLRDAHRRLDTLDAGDTGTAVRAVFSWSLRQLGESAARMFRLLGLHPGPDVSLAAAASLAALPVEQARTALDELTGAHLASEHQPGRFAAHDLLRAYAAEQCQATDLKEERDAAIGRVLDHYLHTGYAAAALYQPSLVLARPPATLPGPQVVLGKLESRGQALDWFRSERAVLIAATIWAAAGGLDAHALRIPLLFRPFLARGGYLQDVITTGRIALAAAGRVDDLAGQAHVHCVLGSTHDTLGACQEADTHLRKALALYQRISDPRGQGITHSALLSLRVRQRRPADALHHAERALEQYRIAGHRPGEAGTLNSVGWIHMMNGDVEQALPYLRQALDLHRAVGASTGLASTWDNLGYAHYLLGQHRQAFACYRRADSLCREFADQPNHATVLVHLGDVHQAAGQLGAARQAWEQALEILADLKDRDADLVRAKLEEIGGSGRVVPGAAGR